MAKIISITNARKDIYKIAESVNEVHEEYVAYNASNGNNIVILSQDDWNSIKESLEISSVKGMTDSIINASKEPLSEGVVYDPSEEW